MQQFQDNCPINTTPLDQSKEIVSPNIINLNYTSQDFWSMKSRLVGFIRERFGNNGTVIPNTFNDFVESDIAVMLIENWAFLADTLSFKMDQIANELFIDTVTEPENAFRLAKLVGFVPQPPIASKSLWTATIQAIMDKDIRLTTPVEVSLATGGSPLTIELFQADSNGNPIFDSDIVIQAGSLVDKSIVGLEGRTYTETFTSTGNVSMVVPLKEHPVIHDSIRVRVDGVTWEQVEFFTDSQPRREYRVEFDSNYNAYVIFGNNRAGFIPTIGSQIESTYRKGGGTIGNIVTNFASVQRMASVDGLGFNMPVTLKNYTQGKYGYDGDTIEDLRYKLPRYLRMQNRCVSGLDYKTFADQFSTAYNGQIGKATATLRNHGCAGNILDIYILAKLGSDQLERASSELKFDFVSTLNDKKMATDFVCVRDGSIILVNVVIEAILDKSYRKFEEEIRVNITNCAQNFFALRNWDYAKQLMAADLTKALAVIKQVDSYEINFETDNEDNSGQTVNAKYYEIVRPDTIAVSFLYR